MYSLIIWSQPADLLRFSDLIQFDISSSVIGELIIIFELK